MKRFIIFSCFLSLFVVIFCTPLSAAQYEYSLKELIDGGSLYVEIVSGNTSSSVQADTNHWTGAVRFFPGELAYWSLDILSNNSSLFSFVPNDSVLSIQTGYFVWCAPDFTFNNSDPDPSFCEMRMYFRILNDDGSMNYIYTPWLSADAYGSSEASFKMPFFRFPRINFEYSLSDDARSVYSIGFNCRFKNELHDADGDSKANYFMMWGGKAKFFVGPLSNAPIYTPPSSEKVDEYQATEDKLLSDTSDGRESFKDSLSSGSSLLSDPVIPSGGINPFYHGLMFVRSFINDLIPRIPWLNDVVTFSLSIGVIVFILGTGIVSRVLSSSGSNRSSISGSNSKKGR